MRRRELLMIVGVVSTAAVLVWWPLRASDPLSLDPDDVRRVEARFDRWGDPPTTQPGAMSADREVIASLLAVVRSGRLTSDHMCASRGVVRFQRSAGAPVELRFLPGHEPEWYEFRAGRRVYRVSRPEFVAAMRRVGVEVPLTCQ